MSLFRHRPSPASSMSRDSGPVCAVHPAARNNAAVRGASAGIKNALAAGGLAALAACVPAAPSQAAVVPARNELVELTASARQLGVERSAPARVLARAAARRYGRKLGINHPRQLRLAGELPGIRTATGKRVRMFRLVQRIGGDEVMWSRAVVMVRGRVVVGISGSGQRTTGRLRTGSLGLSRARQLAEAATPAADTATVADRIVWAGMPGAPPKRPTEAVLVQVDPNFGTPAPSSTELPNGLSSAWEGASPICVVLDARTGDVITTWSGTAGGGHADPPDSSPDAGGASARVTAPQASASHSTPSAATAQASDFRLVRVRDAQGRSEADTKNAEVSLPSRSIRWPEATPPNSSTFDFNRTFQTGATFGGPMATLFSNAELTQSIMCARTAKRCLNRSDIAPPGDFWNIFGNVSFPAGDPTLGFHEGGSKRRIMISTQATSDFDVLAHEMGHEWARSTLGATSNTGETGAMSEAYADIAAFLAGGSRTIFRSIPGVPPLSLENPQFFMGNYRTDCDEIHFNAKIMVRGFLFTRDMLGSSGFTKVQDAYRATLVNGLNGNSGFADFVKLFRFIMGVTAGTSSQSAVTSGFNTVGVNENTRAPACT